MRDHRKIKTRAKLIVLSLSCFVGSVSMAGSIIPPGDLSLRQDIQLLADRGIIKGPVTSWPLAWKPIVADLATADAAGELSMPVALAIARVRFRAEQETGVDRLRYRANVAGAADPAKLRSFADTPRESGQVGVGLSWNDDRFDIELNGQAVTSPDDGKAYRADGSVLGIEVGNYSIGVSTMDRWWGPGWDGSLILSNNARPIPALAIDRTATNAFETPWLRWLGPWDLSVLFGRMESERVVPHARFFGFRLNFRPLPSLEIGLSRTAQWCGDDRPCGAHTFFNLLVGHDNRGDAGIGADNEPGNQLAGVDVRWNTSVFGRPWSLYGQFIGEDEAGGFPSRYLAQGGIETNGVLKEAWSYQLFAELSGTSCDVIKDDIFNCAYNHSIYRTGYRYRGRTIGHAADNDALLTSAGLILSGADGGQWWAIARVGKLNRGGEPDARNSLTATPKDISSIDLYHSRSLAYGIVEIGAGVERLADTISGESATDGRFFVRWVSSR